MTPREERGPSPNALPSEGDVPGGYVAMSRRSLLEGSVKFVHSSYHAALREAENRAVGDRSDWVVVKIEASLKARTVVDVREA